MICPGVEGENLAAKALAALRKKGWDHPPTGSRSRSGRPSPRGSGAAARTRLRFSGSRPKRWRPGRNGGPRDSPRRSERTSPRNCARHRAVQGAGEVVERLPDPGAYAVVLLPGEGGLRTADVYAEADRLGFGRTQAELDERAERLAGSAGAGGSPLAYPDLLVNDLEPAAISLRPDIGDALEALRAPAPARTLLTGSGTDCVRHIPGPPRGAGSGRAARPPDAIVCGSWPRSVKLHLPTDRRRKRLALVASGVVLIGIYYLISRLVPHSELHKLLEEISTRWGRGPISSSASSPSWRRAPSSVWSSPARP